MPYLQEMFNERCGGEEASEYLSGITCSFALLLIILNIPGNLLVILAVIIDPHKTLRSPFNYLMANLAVADLIVGTISGPIAINVFIKEGLKMNVSSLEIHFQFMSYFISCTASILSLTALAIERYYATCYPHTYRRKLTRKRLLGTIACIWIISIIFPCVYFKVNIITYTFIFANTTVLIPVAITAFTYAIMVYKLKQRTKERIKSSSTCLDIYATTTSKDVLTENAFLFEHKITKMFLVVMAALLICYGPAIIFIYIMSLCKSCSCTTLHWLLRMQILFVCLHSTVNFFCYALRSKRFRKAFTYILRIDKHHRKNTGNTESSRTTGKTGVRVTSTRNDINLHQPSTTTTKSWV